MKCLSLIAAAAALFLGACERHSWEDEDANGDGRIDQNETGTKRLYEDKHHSKGDGSSAGEKKDH